MTPNKDNRRQSSAWRSDGIRWNVEIQKIICKRFACPIFSLRSSEKDLPNKKNLDFQNAPGSSQVSRTSTPAVPSHAIKKSWTCDAKIGFFVCLCNLKLTTHANSSHQNPQRNFTEKKTKTKETTWKSLHPPQRRIQFWVFKPSSNFSWHGDNKCVLQNKCTKVLLLLAHSRQMLFGRICTFKS